MANEAQTEEEIAYRDPRHPKNPWNTMYRQVEDGVKRLGDRAGGVSDDQNAQTTMSLFNKADKDGLKSVDHLELNRRGTQHEAGTLAVMIQGQDPYNPANPVAYTKLVEAANEKIQEAMQQFQNRREAELNRQAIYDPTLVQRFAQAEQNQTQNQNENPTREQPTIKM
jgi:hypothetical protein